MNTATAATAAPLAMTEALAQEAEDSFRGRASSDGALLKKGRVMYTARWTRYVSGNQGREYLSTVSYKYLYLHTGKSSQFWSVQP